MIDIPAYFKFAMQLLLTPNGVLTVSGIVGVLWLMRMYNRKMEIPGLEIDVLREESWFVHRDDTHRLVAVVSMELRNKSGQEIRFKSIRFSGYQPRKETPPILLEGRRMSVPLPYPDYVHYYQGADFRLAPFTTQRVWCCYESGSVDLRNRMSAPLVLRSETGKRTAVRVELVRHPYQIQLYREGWA